MRARAPWLLILVAVALVAVAGYAAAGLWSTPERQGSRGTAQGGAAPSGQLPAPTPTPRLVWFQREPYGPVKIDPNQAHAVSLGRLEQGTQVRAVVTVAFNVGASYLTGTPDIDVRVEGPNGVVTQMARARNGAQLSFQAAQSGDYRIVLSNEYSRINAKQVGLQFLQP
jgi:hypothetical protein